MISTPDVLAVASGGLVVTIFGVRLPCALVFSAEGVFGALLGSLAGKAVGGEKLLILVGLLMIVIAVMMFTRKSPEVDGFRPLSRKRRRAWCLVLLRPPPLPGCFGIGADF